MLKKGQIIKHKDGKGERKILEVLGELYFMSAICHFDQSSGLSYTEKDLIDADFIIPQEQWEPSFGEVYFYINNQGDLCNDTWKIQTWQFHIKDFLGIFETSEKAQTALNDIKKKLGIANNK